MGSFYAPNCKTSCLQIRCKFCKNWISVPNIVHQLTLRCKYCKIQSCSIFPDAINSIRRLIGREPSARACPRPTASQWRQTSMTLFVLSPFGDARTYLYLYTCILIQNAIFDGFGGIWTPKCCRPSCGPEKRHFRKSQRVFWDISREIPCTGCFSRRVREKNKNKNKKERPYMSRISPGAPLRPICTNFGSRVRLMDVINFAKLYRNRLRGLNSMSGQIWPFSLDCDIAVNTVWTTVHTVKTAYSLSVVVHADAHMFHAYNL